MKGQTPALCFSNRRVQDFGRRNDVTHREGSKEETIKLASRGSFRHGSSQVILVFIGGPCCSYMASILTEDLSMPLNLIVWKTEELYLGVGRERVTK